MTVPRLWRSVERAGVKGAAQQPSPRSATPGRRDDEPVLFGALRSASRCTFLAIRITHLQERPMKNIYWRGW